MHDRLPRLALRSQLRLQQLNMLLRLIETGTVRHAAEALSLTQSAVTKALKELESAVGVPLFERHGRGLRPTPYCAPLEQFARETLLGLDAATANIRALLRGDAGRVCIGATPGRAEDTLMDALPAIRSAFPNLVPYVHVDAGTALARQLENAQLDFALTSPTPASPRAGLSFLPLALEPLLTLVRPAHPFARELLVPSRALLEAEWVLPAHPDPVREIVGYALLASGSEEPWRLIESNTVAVAMEIALRQDAVTVAPLSLARPAMASHRLVAITAPYRLPALRIGIMRYRRHELRPGAHAVLAFLLRHLRRSRDGRATAVAKAG